VGPELWDMFTSLVGGAWGKGGTKPMDISIFSIAPSLFEYKEVNDINILPSK